MHINILLTAEEAAMNIPEMIMTILITIGIGKFSEYQSPKYYELETVNGNVYSVKVEKNHKYACPLHCKADHYHNVILTDDDIDYSNGSYVLMGLGSDDVYINSYGVAEYAKVDLNKGKKRTELKTLNVQTYLP